MKAERLELKKTTHPCPCCGQEVEDPSPFNPVVLTLETEEEASFLWHLLNNSHGRSFEDYMNDRGIHFDFGINGVKTRLWREFTSVFGLGS